MKTPYSEENQAFSNVAHSAARVDVYPRLFDCNPSLLSFDSASVSDGGEKAILDGQMAVDRIVKVSTPGLRGDISHIIQERFRRPRFSGYRDITITEFNNESGQQSELYKLKAGIFVYGYYCEATRRFGEVIAVDIAALMMGISSGSVCISQRQRNPRSGQDFVSVKFDRLQEAGVVLWHCRGNGSATPPSVRLIRRDPSRPSSRQTMLFAR